MKSPRSPFTSLCGALALITFGALALAASAPSADAEKNAQRDAELLAAAKVASVVKSGKATYAGLCQSCHADAKAKGDSPSNLFDAKWYHGARPSEIERTILNGVMEKGMPGWGAVLPPEDTMAVTAYLLSAQKP